jgi:hypothetical protein
MSSTTMKKLFEVKHDPTEGPGGRGGYADQANRDMGYEDDDSWPDDPEPDYREVLMNIQEWNQIIEACQKGGLEQSVLQALVDKVEGKIY